MPCRKAPKSNRPVKITVPKAAKAARTKALWKVLDHGTEITNNTVPNPRKRSVPNEPGANVCQTYPAKKTKTSTGRNPSRYDLIRYLRDQFRSVRPAARAQLSCRCQHHRHPCLLPCHSRESGNPSRSRISVRSTTSGLSDRVSSVPILFSLRCSLSPLIRLRAARIWSAPTILEHGGRL